MSVYQAAESLYRLYDKVCVVYDGKMVYYGPMGLARNYFFDMGYEPVNRQTTADFLVAVTDPNGRNLRKGFENSAPRTADEFAAYYRNSEIAKINSTDMELYQTRYVEPQERSLAFAASARKEHAFTARKKSKYLLSIPQQIHEVMARRVQILKGDKKAQVINILSDHYVSRTYARLTFPLIGRLCSRVSSLEVLFIGHQRTLLPFTLEAVFCLCKSIIISQTARQIDSIFSVVLFISFIAQAEIPALFEQRRVVARHEKASMYHPFIEMAALTIVDIPITLITLILYSIILYFIIGLQLSASQYL